MLAVDDIIEVTALVVPEPLVERVARLARVIGQIQPFSAKSPSARP